MWEKFKALSTREKAEFIWDYYKLTIFGGLFLLFAVGSLINTIFINPPKDAYVNIAFYGTYVNGEVLIRMEDELNEKLVPVEMQEKYAAEVECYYESGNTALDMAQNQRFSAVVMAKELDVLIGEREIFDWLITGSFVKELSETIGDLDESRLYYGEDSNTGVYGVYGVSIPKESLIPYKIEMEDPVLGIIVNSERVDAAVEVWNYFK